ncbi:MAG: VanZ family protein [Betaproteobacteria bacterium]|nr:VanZ family protein [Betaproteobacteria bacterium]
MHTTLFRLVGIAIVIAIWILSLIPLSGTPPVPGSDKTHHLLAYFACLFCWAQVYRLPLSRLKLAIGFILMGALVECAQGLTSYRFFEWLDMVANAAGVIIAWLVVTVQLSLQRRLSSRRAP